MVVPTSGQQTNFRAEMKTLLNSIMANYGQFMEMLIWCVRESRRVCLLGSSAPGTILEIRRSAAGYFVTPTIESYGRVIGRASAPFGDTGSFALTRVHPLYL